MNEQNIQQNQIIQLQSQVNELLAWKNQKTRQQINYPLDSQSLPALSAFYLRKYTQPTGTTSLQFVTIGNAILGNLNYPTTNSSERSFAAVLSVGTETLTNQSGTESSLNAQVFLQDFPDNVDLNSFFFGYRKPIYAQKAGTTITVTSGGSTMTDSTKTWTTDELAGAKINIFNSSGTFQFNRQIASNTSTVVTIDGTWPATVSGGTYFIFMPLFLGNATNPWRQVYAGGTDVSSGGDGSVNRAIRIGYGTTGGTETIGIFYGARTPNETSGGAANGVVANIGSLFLKTNGGANTTLYVKETTNNDTGWTAK